MYTLTENFGERERRRVISVVPPEHESDLTPLGEARVQELFPGAHRIRFETPREALADALTITVGSEFKMHLLLVLLGLLVIEPLLANRTAFRRRRQGEGIARTADGRTALSIMRPTEDPQTS